MRREGRPWTRQLQRLRTMHWWAQSMWVRCRFPSSERRPCRHRQWHKWTPNVDAELAVIPNGPAKNNGIVIGQAASAAILALRSADHATDLVTYTPGTQPGDWQPTPNPVPFDPPAPAELLPAALPGWGRLTPFVLRRSSQFEPDGPPRLSGKRYARDYNEVKSDRRKDSATRTAEQTSIARFWYEGSPVKWSRIASVLAESQNLDSWDTARLLALINLAMADGFIAGFETKYDFNFWRPVTAIRAGDTDGNDATVADPTWSSLLNTPAIPDYTSTHSMSRRRLC